MSETHHHAHHHDYAAANAKHLSEQAQTYRSELALQLAKHSAGVILQKYPFDANQTEVLDFTCGPSLVGLELLPHVKRLVGADSAQGMVDVFNQYVTDDRAVSFHGFILLFLLSPRLESRRFPNRNSIVFISIV
jgi:hypothetical protein